LFLLTLPQAELNRISKCLKKPLLKSVKKGEAEAKRQQDKKKKKKKKRSQNSWRMKNWTVEEEDRPQSDFGVGKLSLSIGKFCVGQFVRISMVSH
jgi:hypothetical protein